MGKKITEATVHISPVPEAIQSKDDLSTELEVYGEVRHVRIHPARKSAYVHFADVESAAALRGQVIYIGGEEVKVKAPDSLNAFEEGNEGLSLSAHYQEVVHRFKEDSSDPHASLLSFFEEQISEEAVEFVNSLSSAATSKVMKRLVAASAKTDDQNVISLVRELLESSDPTQMESLDVENWADSIGIRAVAKHLKQLGGEDEMGRLGGKFFVKKGELKQWGFTLTVRNSGLIVTTPDDLMDIAGSEEEKAGLIKAFHAKVPKVPVEKASLIEHYREVTVRFQKDSSDPHASLLSFFGGQISEKAIEFVNSLSSAATSKVMKRLVAASAKTDDQNVISLVRELLDSSDPTQMESLDVENWADAIGIRAVAKHLKELGGQTDMGKLGGKFFVKKGELKQWGFICTVRSSGDILVTAPDDLMDIGSEEEKARLINAFQATVPNAPVKKDKFPNAPVEKAKLIEHYREIILRFQEDSSDPHAALLSFFASQLMVLSVEFLSSLTSTVTSNVMQRLASLTESNDQNGILCVRRVLESLDHAQVESLDIGKSAELVVIEAIAKYLKQMGGQADIGPLGSKFKIRKRDLEQWGFVMTPQPGGRGDCTVTAPHDLLDKWCRLATVSPVLPRNKKRPRSPPALPASGSLPRLTPPAPHPRTTAPRPSMAPHIAARRYN